MEEEKHAMYFCDIYPPRMESLVLKKMPNWNREEGLVLLQAYLKNRGHNFSKSSEIVKEVSVTLRSMNPELAEDYPSYRNINGIHMMFMQLKGLDVKHPGKGLERTSVLFKDLWAEFLSSPQHPHTS